MLWITMEFTEILAPAGGKEQLSAAVRCGANAVYFGASAFNARRNAENFSDADFTASVGYAHAYGVKVYVTLNTLVTDSELPALTQTLRLICKSGADAVIVQDMAVAALVRTHCPTLPLHASTQMAVHNLAGVKELEGLGFKRIVLARELSLSEIRYICGNTSAEIEVFVHGAHCMSVSGLCYFSSVLGARSGNRGLCAQPCRLNFKSDGREYALSLKDMSLISHISELKEAGVTSLKIEGRMKRPEYVAAAVTACRNALDGAQPDLETLKSVFSRSGFTDGYFTGKRTLDMFGYRTKDDVLAASPVLGSLASLYRAEVPRIPADMSVSIKKGKKTTLTMTDGEHTVTVTGDVPEAALTRSVDEEACRRNLFKLGSTPFVPRELKTDIDEGLSLPASALNALRRDAAEKLQAQREKPTEHVWLDRSESFACSGREDGQRKIRARFEKASQLIDGVNFERVILPVDEILANERLIQKLGAALICEIPVLLWQNDENTITEKLKNLHAAGVHGAVCENIGAIRLAREAGMRLYAGHHLNILNSAALHEYEKLGVTDATLSVELSADNMRRVYSGIKTGYIAYGYLPLMRFRCCPMQKTTGCAHCSGQNDLTDRTQTAFTVLCSGKKYSTLCNSVPLYVGDKAMPKLSFETLYFTKESKEECERIFSLFRYGKFPDFNRTNGLYFKELL